MVLSIFFPSFLGDLGMAGRGLEIPRKGTTSFVNDYTQFFISACIFRSKPLLSTNCAYKNYKSLYVLKKLAEAFVCLNLKITENNWNNKKNSQWVFFQVRKTYGSYKQAVWEALPFNFISEKSLIHSHVLNFSNA